MKNSKEGLRFTHLEVENFKSIDKKVINIAGRSFLITGKNERGKSTLIQALLSGIDDKKNQPSVAIKTGETKASTKVKIEGTLNGEKREYTLEVYYTPKNQKGRLVLLDEKGEEVKSPASKLDSIIGDISFDIFKFLKAKKQDQIKVLKDISGVGVEIDKLDMEYKKLYTERTFMNRKVEEADAVMKNHGLTQDEIDLYSEPINIEPLQEELAGISKKITDYNDIKYKTNNFKKQSDACYADIDENVLAIKELENKIANLKQLNDELARQAIDHNDKHLKGVAWLEKNPEPSAEDISNRMKDASLHNENHQKVSQLADRHKALLHDKETLQKLNEDMEVILNKKSTIIKKSKLPIKGLTFTDEDILYNGLPLEEGQINTQTLIDIGFEISMALNPNLRVIFLHEGSLFDQESLNALIKKCEDRGYQLICEIVNDNPDLEVVFTEEIPE